MNLKKKLKTTVSGTMTRTSNVLFPLVPMDPIELPEAPKPYRVFYSQREYEQTIAAEVARQAPVIRAAAEERIKHVVRKEMEEEYQRQKAHFEEETNAFWEKCKDEFKSGSEDDNFISWCRVMWAIPIKVLVESFHWKPITEDCCCDNRQALVKFCNNCMTVAMTMLKDQNKDIRTLCKEVTEAYGAGFVINEEAIDDC